MINAHIRLLVGLFLPLLLIVTATGSSQTNVPQAQLLAAKSIKCQFAGGNQAEWDSNGKLKITGSTLPASMSTPSYDSIDRRTGKARLLAAVGPINVSVMATSTGITLIEETALGNLNFTTVFSDNYSAANRRFLAVQSFHQSAKGPFPAQYYGTCEAW